MGLGVCSHFTLLAKTAGAKLHDKRHSETLTMTKATNDFGVGRTRCFHLLPLSPLLVLASLLLLLLLLTLSVQPIEAFAVSNMARNAAKSALQNTNKRKSTMSSSSALSASSSSMKFVTNKMCPFGEWIE